MDVRNKDGIWINSQVFREDALHFQKHGYYCADPWGSPAWYEYWNDRRNRIINGYTSQGVKITGDHYFYLNFCPIMKTEDTTSKKSKKVRDFPDFWDGDYEYFWTREIARKGIVDSLDLNEEWEHFQTVHTDSKEKALELKRYLETLHLQVKIEPDYLLGGWNLIVGKSRRKGYSYKNAAIGAKNYFTVPESLTIYGAYEKKFLTGPKAIFPMVLAYVNFINDNTAWAMPSDFANTKEQKRASYKEYKNGVELEKGFKSELGIATFKDNPDAVRGRDLLDLYFEESGAFGTPGLLKSSYAASEDCVKDGEIKTGMITVFGTSGDMEGGTADYAEMFNNPKRFSMLPMENIWEEDERIKGSVGFFHPVNWNLPGFMDEQGNSFVDEAKKHMLNERERLIEHGATSLDLQQKMQEKPLNPREAFSYTNINIFPTLELQRQKDIIIANNWQKLKGQPVILYRDPETNKVVSEPDLKNKLNPITTLEHVGSVEGCPVIYEYPVSGAPRGLYKIGYDPVRQDEGTSLASITVYKSTMIGEHTKEMVVAEYIGRKETPDDVHLIAELLAELYNTQIMYENEVPDVKTYFERRRLLHLLALQPDAVISKNVKTSKVARVYGCHMNTQLKDAGERYIKQWLTEVVDFDENNNPITNISNIYSLRLIEELLNYNKKGNFDSVSSLIMCMFQVQQEVLGKTYNEKAENKNAKKLLESARRKKHNYF